MDEIIPGSFLYDEHGHMIYELQCPKCKVKLEDDGGCSEGCCDDYKCPCCNHRIRVECPD